MSWFKQGAGGDKNMSDSIFDVKPTPKAFNAEPVYGTTYRSPVTEATPEPEPEFRPASVADDVKPAAASKPQGSVLGTTLRFRGELRADEDFTLQGRIEGSIHHTKSLTIGPDGYVKGDSRAKVIIVEGTVEGGLYALESISIRATARVTGNLFAPRVSISDGASFNGKIDMATAAKAAKSITEIQSAAALDDRDADRLLSGT